MVMHARPAVVRFVVRLALASLVLAAPARAQERAVGCAFEAPREEALNLSLRDWSARWRLGPITTWDASFDRDVLRLGIHWGAQPWQARIAAGATCSDLPTLLPIPGVSNVLVPVDAHADLLRVVSRHLRSTQVEQRERVVAAWQPTGPGWRAPEESLTWGRAWEGGGLLFRVVGALVALGLSLLVIHGGGLPGHRRRSLFAGVGILLAGLAISSPLLLEPIVDSAMLSRVLWARAGQVNADPGHPFLLFALANPVLKLSVSPFAVRALPLAFALAEALLLFALVRRVAGPVAGVVGALALLAGLRSRGGVLDFNDWTLAGLLLTLWLMWWIREDEGDTARPCTSLPWLGVCLALGLFSSWLMVFPLAVFAVTAWIPPRDGVPGRRHAWALRVAVVVGLMIALAWFGFVRRDFSAGVTAPAVREAAEALRLIVRGSLPARAPWLAALVLLGLIGLARSHRRAAFFGAGSVLLVVGALAWLARYERFEPRYARLLDPLFAAALGVGTGHCLFLGRRALGRLSRGARAWTLPPVAVAMAWAVALPADAGVRPEPANHARYERLGADLGRRDAVIVSSYDGLDKLVAYARLRGGAATGSLGSVAAGRQAIALDPVACTVERALPPGTGDVVLVHYGWWADAFGSLCLRRLLAACVEIPASAQGERAPVGLWTFTCPVDAWRDVPVRPPAADLSPG